MDVFRTLSLRTRLIAALAIPLLVLTVIAVAQVASSARFSNEAQQQLDEVDRVVLTSELAVIVRNERDVLLRFGATASDLSRFRDRTDFALAQIIDEGAAAGFSEETLQTVRGLRDELLAVRIVVGDNPRALASTLAEELQAGVGFEDEGSTYGGVLAFDDITNRLLTLVELDNETLIDPATAQDLSSLRLAQQLDNRVSFEAANYVLLQQLPNGAVTDEVVALQVSNRSESEIFQAELTSIGDGDTRARLNDLFGSEVWNDFEDLRARVSQVGPSESLAFDTPVVNAAIAEITGELESVQVESINTLFASAFDSRAQANRQVVATIVFSLALLALLAAIVFWLYRTIRSPISNLTTRSRAIAEVELPEVVELMRAGGVEEEIPTIEPITAETEDEIGELVQAFNGMHQTAITLAAEQAGSRRTVGDMFVNLGRRNQKLLIRMLDELDELEAVEKDPQRLASLYRVDRLATRMRRNAESLLVLAGAAAARRVDQPVPLSEVARSGVSEVEQFDRVDIIVTEDAMLDGAVAVDTAHLIAELTENALHFSPADRRVAVRLLRAREGVRVVVIDEGLGMTTEKLALANQRITEAANDEESPSKQLGLFVVGRLAGRHGLTVTLQEGIVGGITAVVDVPSSILVGESNVSDDEGVDSRSVDAPRVELGANSPARSASLHAAATVVTDAEESSPALDAAPVAKVQDDDIASPARRLDDVAAARTEGVNGPPGSPYGARQPRPASPKSQAPTSQAPKSAEAPTPPRLEPTQAEPAPAQTEPTPTPTPTPVVEPAPAPVAGPSETAFPKRRPGASMRPKRRTDDAATIAPTRRADIGEPVEPLRIDTSPGSQPSSSRRRQTGCDRHRWTGRRRDRQTRIRKPRRFPERRETGSGITSQTTKQ